jgi:two-component system chemotaxis response regulator CheB
MESIPGSEELPKRAAERTAPRHVVAVASSTGGPTAILQLVSRIGAGYPNALVITQHMPEKFTRTFAERLARRSELDVTEAADLDEVCAGSARVCPGGRCMTLELAPTSSIPKLRVRMPAAEDRYVPSADRLFASVSRLWGPRAVGVILTGMGDDGVAGARAILEGGGVVIAESEATAVVYGMPGAAVRAGVVSQSLALQEIAEYLAALR